MTRVQNDLRSLSFINCFVILVLLVGCHPLERTVSDVIGARLKDPASLQLRNIHRGHDSDGTICGEYNAKNTFGGYVGFRPFSIETFRQNSLTIIDDDATVDAKIDYELKCGTEEQRAQAEVARMIEKREAERAKALAAEPSVSLSRPQQTHSEGEAIGSSTSPMSASFDKPDLPTAIEQTQCHMGECFWEQIAAVHDVIKERSETLRKAVIRQTETTTPEGQEYPAVLSTEKHDWKTRTSYFLCSLKRPAAIDWNDDSRDWLVTQLTLISPAGYQLTAVAEYKRVCHGIRPKSNLDQHPDQLGYVDRDDVDQPHIRQPTDVLM